MKRDGERGVERPMRPPNYFVAVPLPDAVKRELQERCGRLKDKFDYRKWTHGRDYHITLKFFGNCPPQQLRPILREVSAAVRGTPAFTLSLQGIGYFGGGGSPRVLWAGVRGELEALGRLQSAVERAAAVLGFPPETRPYSPHVTLARQYQGTPVPFGEQAEAWGRDWESEAWTVRSVVLYRTDFGRTPMYAPVEEARFGV